MHAWVTLSISFLYMLNGDCSIGLKWLFHDQMSNWKTRDLQRLRHYSNVRLCHTLVKHNTCSPVHSFILQSLSINLCQARPHPRSTMMKERVLTLSSWNLQSSLLANYLQSEIGKLTFWNHKYLQHPTFPFNTKTESKKFSRKITRWEIKRWRFSFDSS